MSADVIRLADRGRPFRPRLAGPISVSIADTLANMASLNAALYGAAAQNSAHLARLYREQRGDSDVPSDTEPAA